MDTAAIILMTDPIPQPAIPDMFNFSGGVAERIPGAGSRTDVRRSAPPGAAYKCSRHWQGTVRLL